MKLKNYVIKAFSSIIKEQNNTIVELKEKFDNQIRVKFVLDSIIKEQRDAIIGLQDEMDEQMGITLVAIMKLDKHNATIIEQKILIAKLKHELSEQTKEKTISELRTEVEDLKKQLADAKKTPQTLKRQPLYISTSEIEALGKLFF